MSKFIISYFFINIKNSISIGQKNDIKNNPLGKTLIRRSFLGATATAAAAFTIIPHYVMGGKGYTAPSDIINVAGIGVGSQGGGDTQQICTQDVPIIRPVRNFNGTPMSKEQIAEQAGVYNLNRTLN